jgi:NAD(P)-dependent dehydrogenase (short-subunit alcohol dehydrogenase family)
MNEDLDFSGRLNGKVAIVTGVSQPGQVGFALASAFVREGARVAISSRSAERVAARLDELPSEQPSVKVSGRNAERIRAQLQEMQERGEIPPVEKLAVAADLTTEEGAEKLIKETLAAFGRIDILVNLAGGLTKYGPSAELALADWEAELNNNLRTTFLCTRAVWPIMQRQGGGKILNFSRAGSAQSASPNMAAYNAAKAGVDALTVTFAKEGKQHGISVNAIGPGLIVTQSNLESMHPSSEELAGKWVSMEQIVEAAIFLVSAASDGVNGVILPVQGRGI